MPEEVIAQCIVVVPLARRFSTSWAARLARRPCGQAVRAPLPPGL